MSASIKICDVFKLWLAKKDVVNLSFRTISSSNCYLNKYGAREARFFNKMIGNKSTGRSEETPSASPFPKAGSLKGGQNQRRIAVLNKLFMRHISEMMSTGGLAKEIVDKEYSKTVEVNRILATADFGEEYVPVDAGFRLKSEFSQTSERSPEILSQVQKLERKEIENEILDLPLPPMRNDVLGLKHAEIMAKIKKGMKKAKALHRQTAHHLTTSAEDNETEPAVNTTTNLMTDESILHHSLNPKKEEFTKFLMKRQFEKKKMNRRKKNYTPEMELHETEVLENSKVAAEFMENIDMEKDYIDEEDKHKI
ncbi:hypothetical protein C0J52_22609 [Blattella germanica]|nr:hypothetical protein C0J52_22609 [Blattella germanica]